MNYFDPSILRGHFDGENPLGAKNTSSLQFLAFGDWRTAVAFNDNGALEVGQLATRLNLDLDPKTHRHREDSCFHPVPLIKAVISRGMNFLVMIALAALLLELDGNIDTLFFEGDIGAIYSGFIDETRHL